MAYIQLIFWECPSLFRFRWREIISEDDHYVVEVSNMGATVRKRKDHPSMFYGHIDHPIKGRDDWERYKLRFQSTSPG